MGRNGAGRSSIESCRRAGGCGFADWAYEPPWFGCAGTATGAGAGLGLVDGGRQGERYVITAGQQEQYPCQHNAAGHGVAERIREERLSYQERGLAILPRVNPPHAGIGISRIGRSAADVWAERDCTGRSIPTWVRSIRGRAFAYPIHPRRPSQRKRWSLCWFF